MERKSLWNEGSIAGIALGAVSIAYLFLSMLLAKVPAILPVFWLAKLVGCILLMRFFMIRVARKYPEADNGDTFKFGVIAAFCSALLYSASYLAYILYLAPDTFTEAINMMMESSSAMLDSNSIEMLEQIEPKLPRIAFFANFFWCFFIGLVLSAIFSRNIPSRNPFDEE